MTSAIFRRGRTQGASSHLARLKPMDVLFIFLSKEKPDYLAAMYKVAVGAIYKIKRGQTWDHITRPFWNTHPPLVGDQRKDRRKHEH